MRRLVVGLLVLLMVGATALSAEPASSEEQAVVAAEEEVSSPEVEKPVWLDTAATALTAIGQGALAIFLAWALKKVKDDLAMKDAVQSLEVGVDDAWVNFVKELKKKANDGKLTEDEKQNARTWAWEKAKEVATGSGRKLLVKMGVRALKALISKIVRKRKSGG